MARLAAAERVVSRVTPGIGGCWIFIGATSGKGYPAVRDGCRIVGAHRVMYETDRGPIPDGWHIDHRCGVRRCVRPDHLEAITPRENDRRSRSMRPPWYRPCPSCGAARGESCRRLDGAGPTRAHRSRR